MTGASALTAAEVDELRRTAAVGPLDPADVRRVLVLMGLGDQGEQVAGEMDPASLVRGALQAAAQGGDQASVLIGDHQPHPAQPSRAQ